MSKLIPESIATQPAIMRYSNLILCGLVIAALQPAFAQVPAIQQVDSVQQRRQLDQSALDQNETSAAPELFAGETSDVGPQSVVKRAPRKSLFEASADVQFFHTDNMFLADSGKQSTEVLVSTVQFALAPTPYLLGDGQFSPRIGYRHQWFNYGLASDKSIDVFDFNTATFRTAKLSEFDFNVQTLFADARWQRGNWIFGTGFDYQRLLDSDGYDQFYRESVPRWEVRRIFRLCDSSALGIAYEGDYRFTDSDFPPLGADSDFNDRTDHSLVVNYSYALCAHAVVQPYYRFQYTRYTSGENRNDYLNTFGLALHCPVNRNIAFRAFVGYDILRTDSQIAQDYNKLDVGGGVSLIVRF